MSKVIFTDVDGTIYDYDGYLPPSTVEAIRKLRQNGHRVYMVTGRSKAENRRELWDIGFDGMIGGNGSYIESDGQIIRHETLSYEQCQRIVKWCQERNIDFYEESNNGLFASKNFCLNSIPVLKRYKAGKGASTEELEDLKAENVIHGLVENEELVRADLNKVSFILHSYDDYLEAVRDFPDLKVGTWGGKDEEALFGDFALKDIDKAKAIGILLEYLGVDEKDTIAIGDANVDIPMLAYCETGITFVSGGEEIRKMADIVTAAVSDDGFYQAFAKLGLI